MSRRDKKTRMRLLPPKIQMQEAESYAGMVPGNLPAILSQGDITASYRSFFADTDTVLFTRQNLEPGIGVMSGSNWITSSNQLITSSFYVSGNAVKGIADGLVYRRRQELPSRRPFYDFGNPAVDGKSVDSSFYATGSSAVNVGEELYQPVWSKAKFEIDLSPAGKSEVILTNEPDGPVGVQTTTMAFWDDTLKLWVDWRPTGYSMAWNSLAAETDPTASVKHWLDQGMVGFGGSAIPIKSAGAPIFPISQALGLLGRPITNFGFPDHRKFEVASSGTIPMSRYISRPFLAEKIVLIFSGSVGFDDGWFRQLAPNGCGAAYYAAWSFFILNQRNFRQQMRIHPVKCFGSSSGINSGFILNTSSLGETTSRDLVTWMQISHVPSSPLAAGFDDSLMKREWWYSRDINPGMNNITGSFEISGVVKVPVPFKGLSALISERTVGATGSAGRGGQFIESWTPTSRRLNSDMSERSWNNPTVLPQIIAAVTESNQGWLFSPSSNIIQVGNVYEYPSPYLLMPTDNLILGWQLPVPVAIGWNSGSYAGGVGDEYYPVSGSGPRMNFYAAGINKLVVYGSFLEEGKESTEVLDLDPTCISVRRVIGD